MAGADDTHNAEAVRRLLWPTVEPSFYRCSFQSPQPLYEMWTRYPLPGITITHRPYHIIRGTDG